MANSDSSFSTTVVAIVALIVIIALGFILYRSMPRQNTGTDINVQVPLPTNGSNGAQ